MEFEINQLISQSKISAADLFKSYLMLMVDGFGTVLHIWHNPSFPHPRSITGAIRANHNIFKSFDLKPYGRLEDLPEKVTVFPDRMEHLTRTGAGNFFSRLPYCNLALCRVAPNLFLGAVWLSHFTPTVFYGDSGIVVYLDEEERLCGFNRAFYEYFKDGYREPGLMLDQPARHFFTPTPRQVQKDYLDALTPLLNRDMDKTPFEGLSQLKRRAAVWPEGETHPGEEGFLWVNSQEDRYGLITLNAPIDCMAEDFLLEAEIEFRGGLPPIFMVGGTQNENDLPDDVGYGLSESPDRRHWLIKKRGYTIARFPRGAAGHGVISRFRFFKSGLALVLEIDGETAVRYYDFDFIENTASRVSLALRPGSAVNLKSLSLRTRRLPARLQKEKAVLRLQTREPHYFTLNHMFSERLSVGRPQIRSFVLYDITQLQQNMDTLRHLSQDREKERDRLRSILTESRDREGLFLGGTRAMVLIREKADIIADSNATVLVQGETGTGKEMLARYIHFHSPFAKGPFVKVDCSTLSPTLIESELFGHEKGAFTGAAERKRGKFEQAAGGTLFLDEINSLNLQTQAKILQFLQDLVITRVGGEKPLRLDLRIIIASNIPVEEMVGRGEFRADLFFRINMMSIGLPPLRERLDDIPELSECFLQEFSRQYGKPAPVLTAGAYRKLYACAWPGNVRQLRNVLNKAFLFAAGSEIREDLIELPAGGAEVVQLTAPGPGRPRTRSRKGLSREEVEGSLLRQQGNVYRMAKELNIARQVVYYYLRKFGLDADASRK